MVDDMDAENRRKPQVYGSSDHPPVEADTSVATGRGSGRMETDYKSPGGTGATGGTSYGVPGPSRLSPGGTPDFGLLELADSLTDFTFPATREEIVNGLRGQRMHVGETQMDMADLVGQLRSDHFGSLDEVVRGVSGLADFLVPHGASRERPGEQP